MRSSPVPRSSLPLLSLVLPLALAAALAAPACKRGEPPPPAAPPAPAPVAAPMVRGTAAPAAGAARVAVQVTEAGFVPENIPAQAGKPITLAITRKTERTCATEI